jgi:hypothetical protein
MGTQSIGVDWVSMGIFLVAYALSQVNSIPLKIRYAVLSAACAAIGFFRVERFGLKGINAAFTGFAIVLCIYYAVRVATARDQPRVQRGDDD